MKSKKPKKLKKMKTKTKKNSKPMKSAMSSPDIIKMILEDHKPLKKLIKILKDADADHVKRMQAFEEFAPLLVTHAKSEEEVLYVYMKDIAELRTEGFEGDVEHGLADQMLEEATRTEDEDLWSARVKVLAELVEHHIEEEEDELLPDFRKHSDIEMRAHLAEQYLTHKRELQAHGGKDTVDEKGENIVTSQFQL